MFILKNLKIIIIQKIIELLLKKNFTKINYYFLISRIKSDKETEIKDKLKQIAIEKNRLRILGPKPAAPQVLKQPIVAKPQPKPIENPVNTVASISKLESLVNCAGGNLNGIKQKKDTPSATEANVVKMDTDTAKDEIEVVSSFFFYIFNYFCKYLRIYFKIALIDSCFTLKKFV